MDANEVLVLEKADFCGNECQSVFRTDEPIRQSNEAIYDNSIGAFAKGKVMNRETKKENVYYTCLEKHKRDPLLFCGQIFDKVCNLKDHIKTHRGLKPFKCSWPGCLKSAAQKSQILKHEEVHLKKRTKKQHRKAEEKSSKSYD